MNEQEDSAGKVGKRAVYGKPHADAERGDESRHAAGVDAEITDESDQDEDFQAEAKDMGNRSVQRFIQGIAGFFRSLADPFADLVDHREGDEQNEQRDHDLDAGAEQPCLHREPERIGIHHEIL